MSVPLYWKKSPRDYRGLENIIEVEGYETLQHPQVAKYTIAANTTIPIIYIGNFLLSILPPNI